MGLVDSHAHLTFPELKDQVEDVLQRCQAAGVDGVITIGTTLGDSKQGVELAGRYPGRIHAAAGIHPHEAKNASEKDLSAMARLWEHPSVVGIGEIGLDYHYGFSDPAVQRAVFERQLLLARATELPLIIHCREALDDTIPLLADQGFSRRRVVFHCFTGTGEDAGRIAEHGWRVSFSGIVTFGKSTPLQEVAKAQPAGELMVETDAPFLSPVPLRGKKPNEPAYVAHIARFLADLREEPYDTLVERTAENTRQFFDLP